MKIGLFGGTFNPPHKGHTRLLAAFCEQMQFDKVLIVPDKRPVHKICEDLALDSERLDMCRLAFCDEKYEVSSMEIDRESDSYSVYTVREILEQYPDAQLYLIIGSDMFLSFHKWYKYREILDKCILCVASRSGEEDIQALRSYAFTKLRMYIGETLQNEHIVISPVEPFEISSTELRRAIANGEETYAYLDAAVENYIHDRGLYGYRKKR